MAVIEGVCRIVGGVDTHKDLHVAAIVDEQDRIIGTRSFATTRQGLSPNAGLDALLRSAATHRNRVDRQLWCRAPALHATSKGHGPRGHDSGQAGSASAWQERRSRRAERRPCRLCRPADRDAAKPGRHDRIPAGSEGLPEDGCERQAYRPADDPQHDRLRPRWPARSTAQPHPHAAHPYAGLVATRSYRLSRPGFCLSNRPQIPRPPLPRAA